MAARQYSNPRLEAIIDGWPYGRHHTTATFSVETNAKYGQRGVRHMRHPTNGSTSVKKLTYAQHVRIVDGDDGKTYFAEFDAYGNITIMHGDMKYQAEYAHRYDAERHATLAQLFQ